MGIDMSRKRILALLPALLIFLLISSEVKADRNDTDAYNDALKIRMSILRSESDDSTGKTLSQCIKANESTSALSVCYDDAYVSYNVLLNNIYSAALDSMDESSQAQLRVSQRKWLAFRDAEAKMYAMDWKKNMGTIIGPAISWHRIGMIKERILELTLYLGADEQ